MQDFDKGLLVLAENENMNCFSSFKYLSWHRRRSHKRITLMQQLQNFYQSEFTCSESTLETPEKCGKYVQS